MVPLSISGFYIPLLLVLAVYARLFRETRRRSRAKQAVAKRSIAEANKLRRVATGGKPVEDDCDEAGGVYLGPAKAVHKS